MLEQNPNTTVDLKKDGEERAVYVPPKVEVLPLEDIVKAGVTFSSDGTGPGKT